MKPRHLRLGMNLWPPFLGAGIRVRHIAEDWSEVIVDLRHGLMNRNYVGTHYGGSLFSMTDPFYALMLMHLLGERYLVWDQAASIEFVAPGRGTVTARFALSRLTRYMALTFGSQRSMRARHARVASTGESSPRA